MTRVDIIIHDEQHMTYHYSPEELHAAVGKVQREIDADRTCGYGETHTGPPNFNPTGPRCGAPATHVIFWDDGRWSLGCPDHLGPFEEPAPPCYVVALPDDPHSPHYGPS